MSSRYGHTDWWWIQSFAPTALHNNVSVYYTITKSSTQTPRSDDIIDLEVKLRYSLTHNVYC